MKNEQEQGYWILTEDGYRFYPVTEGSPRSAEAFRRVWLRHSFWLFVVLAGLFTLYLLGPFPPVELFGLVLHP
jgi:hypothetical protein